MQITEVLAKVTEGKDLSDEEKTFLKEYKEVDVQGEVNKRAKAIKDEAEAKAKGEIEKLTGELTKLKEELESAKSGDLSEVEKIQKEVDKLKESIAEKDAQVEALNKEKTTLTREHKLDALFSDIKFIEGANTKGMRRIFGLDLAEVDLEDEDAVKAAVDKYREENKTVVSASGVGGAGTSKEDSTGGTTDQKDPSKQSNEERLKIINKKEESWD